MEVDFEEENLCTAAVARTPDNRQAAAAEAQRQGSL
jgi:hypothetical protein